MHVSSPPDERELRKEFVERRGDQQTLVDVLDRAIDRGVVVAGDVVLSVAGVDLVHLELRLRLQGVAVQITADAQVEP